MGFAGIAWLAVVAASAGAVVAIAAKRLDRAGLALVFAGSAIIAATASPPMRPLARAKAAPPPSER